MNNIVQRSQAQLHKLTFVLLIVAVSSFVIAKIPDEEVLVVSSITIGVTCVSLAVIAAVLNMVLDIWNVRNNEEAQSIIDNHVYSTIFMLISAGSLYMTVLFHINCMCIIYLLMCDSTFTIIIVIIDIILCVSTIDFIVNDYNKLKMVAQII